MNVEAWVVNRIARFAWLGMIVVLATMNNVQGETVVDGKGSGGTAGVIVPRARVIIDNDFGGDADGLFQLAQHLLSPSVEVRGVIGSHQYDWGFYGYPGSAEHACEVAGELLKVLGPAGKVKLLRGAEGRLTDMSTPIESEAAKFIVAEAMRDDTKLPLYVVCGAGLTDLASAYLMEPKIGKRVRLVWIGGPEYDGFGIPTPGAMHVEYNLGIDRVAGQVIFNQSDIDLWQVPRNTYRQAMVSYAELNARIDRSKPIGGFLMGRLEDLMKRANGSLGEAYVLGDSPLVLLTALQSAWEVDPASCEYITRPAPMIDDDGQYQSNPEGRPIRVYTNIDNRLMFEDLYAKLKLAGAATGS